MATNIFAQFAAIQGELESKSYFDLRGNTKGLVDSLAKENKKLPIEAWSFVPHPDVLAEISKLQRYLVTIDTQASKVYFPVYEFLRSQKANVTSYYSGGWADFVCDIHYDKKNFESWLSDLRLVLDEAGGAQYSEHDGVDGLISIFEVTKPHFMCRKLITDVGKSWSRKSAQDDKWSFCLTAGTLWPANQERP